MQVKYLNSEQVDALLEVDLPLSQLHMFRQINLKDETENEPFQDKVINLFHLIQH